METEDIANTLLSKNLLVQCDRVVKNLRPGKKKLSTWQAHLEIFPDQAFSDNDAFFAWAFVRLLPRWQTLLSFFWPVLTLVICLFPVYPHHCKQLMLYSCAGVLLLIFFLLLIRAAVFGALFIILGKWVWFFLNILTKEATRRELFRFWPKEDEEECHKWTTRLFYAILSVLVPDEAARARYQKRVSNIIDDVLEWSVSKVGSLRYDGEAAHSAERHQLHRWEPNPVQTSVVQSEAPRRSTGWTRPRQRLRESMVCSADHSCMTWNNELP